jgi:quinoprotein glucose dehydrogenase
VLALGCLLTYAQAQPLPANPIAPSDNGTNMLAATGLDPVAGKAVLAQWRVDLAGLAGTNTDANDQVISAWLDQLLAGKVPEEIQFEVLAAASRHSTPTNREKLEPYLNAHADDEGLSAHGVLLYGGDAAAGRKIFFQKSETPCSKCHRVGGEGASNGPPLDGIGTNLTREVVLQSILSPNAKITKCYESARIKTKDRRGFSGLIKHETDTELTLDCPPDGDITFLKSDLALREVGSSPMPDGLDSALSKSELRDLIEYLAELR